MGTTSSSLATPRRRNDDNFCFVLVSDPSSKTWFRAIPETSYESFVDGGPTVGLEPYYQAGQANAYLDPSTYLGIFSPSVQIYIVNPNRQAGYKASNDQQKVYPQDVANYDSPYPAPDDQQQVYPQDVATDNSYAAYPAPDDEQEVHTQDVVPEPFTYSFDDTEHIEDRFELEDIEPEADPRSAELPSSEVASTGEIFKFIVSDERLAFRLNP